MDLLGRPNGATLYKIYSKTHLNYGMEEAIRRYKEALQSHFMANACTPLHYCLLLALHKQVFKLKSNIDHHFCVYCRCCCADLSIVQYHLMGCLCNHLPAKLTFMIRALCDRPISCKNGGAEAFHRATTLYR